MKDSENEITFKNSTSSNKKSAQMQYNEFTTITIFQDNYVGILLEKYL